jgi:DNA polymerase-1
VSTSRGEVQLKAQGNDHDEALSRTKSFGEKSDLSEISPAYRHGDDVGFRVDSPTVGATIPYQLIRTPADLAVVAQALDESAAVGLDTETTSLNPRDGRVRPLSLATERGTYLIDCFVVDPRPLWDVLQDKTIVAHNAAFDLGFLYPLGFTPGPVRDTMILSQVLYAGQRQPHNLQACAERELGKALDKEQRKTDWTKPLTHEQLDYAALDAAVLVPLFGALDAEVRESGLSAVADIEHRCLPALVWLARSGVAFNKQTWQGLGQAAEEDFLRLAKELDAVAPPPSQPGMFGSGWNWDSPEQVK